MKTKIYKTEEAFNKAIENARKKYSRELWTEIDSTSKLFRGAKYEETNDPVESWAGTTTAVCFVDDILENLIIIII